MKIYKYPIPIDGMTVIKMPEGAKILTVQLQNGEPHIWALVNPANKYIDRVFYLNVTGATIEDRETYIGTFQLQDGKIVLHLFEDTKYSKS